MSVVPRKFPERIGYCEAHIEPFTTNATAIGTTASAVTDLQSKTQAARDALTVQTAARVAAKAATSALKTTVEAMSIAMQDIIKQIRVKASTSGDGVYNLAQIPPPAPPSTRPEPGTPSDFNVTLDAGALILKWKCSNPPGTSGTIYQIWRRTGPTGGFEYVGAVGEKKFTDDTLPAGSSEVTYKIQASRSTKNGLWGTLLVQFGTPGAGGALIASVTEGTPSPTAPKIAA